jgi:hypothetical protein
MADLLTQLGIGLGTGAGARSSGPTADPGVYGPFAPAVLGLERAAQTYLAQRQESAMLDSVADALANELSRYASNGRLPANYVERFSKFNSLPLNQKRALVSQGALLLQQNQMRDEVEAEQGRQNLQLMGNVMQRILNAYNMWVDNRRLAAKETETRRGEQLRRQQALAIAKSAGVKLPAEIEQAGELDPSLLTHVMPKAPATESGLDEETARKAAEELNKQVRGLNRKAVAVPVSKDKWRVSLVPAGRQSGYKIDPRDFDADKDNVLSREEMMKYRQALVESQVSGGVYEGMDLRRLDEAPLEEEDLDSILEMIDTSRLR